MNLEPLLNLGSKIARLFRLMGRLEFVLRLHDFLLHEGRRSRTATLEQTAKVVLELERAEAQRIQNSRAILELMQAAGFSDEQIQLTLSNPQEMNRVSAALTAMLKYIEDGKVSVELVGASQSDSAPEPVHRVYFPMRPDGLKTGLQVKSTGRVELKLGRRKKK